MSLPGSVQNQQLETVRLRIFRSEEKKEFFKKKSNENVVVPFGTDANNRDTRRTRSHEKKNAAVAL
jgi:hypothetical protein